MAEYKEQLPSNKPITPETITLENYEAAYRALWEFANDKNNEKRMGVGDIWALSRQIRIIIRANTKGDSLEFVSRNYPNQGQQFHAHTEEGILSSLVLQVEDMDDPGIVFRSLTIPQNLHSLGLVYSISAYDASEADPVDHRPINDILDSVVPDPEHNPQFNRIAKQITQELLDTVRMTEGIFDESKADSLPDFFPAD